jgi:methenyltetrahydromethanopterin cyclohydrolase
MDQELTPPNLNALAVEIADGMQEDAAALRVRVHTLPGGARVIDAGVEIPGGLDAGLALSEICMGGLGTVTYAPITLGSEMWPGVTVWTDHPAVSCMASQYAGWAISVNQFFAMGSGPLRAHARVEKELFAKLDYKETAEPARRDSCRLS